MVSHVSLSNGSIRIKCAQINDLRVLPKRRAKSHTQMLMTPGVIIKNRCPKCPNCARNKKNAFLNVGIDGLVECD